MERSVIKPETDLKSELAKTTSTSMAKPESGQADKVFFLLKKEMSLCEAHPNAHLGCAFGSLWTIWPMSM